MITKIIIKKHTKRVKGKSKKKRQDKKTNKIEKRKRQGTRNAHSALPTTNNISAKIPTTPAPTKFGNARIYSDYKK